MNTITLHGYIPNDPICRSMDAASQSLSLRFTLRYYNSESEEEARGPRNYLPCHLALSASELPSVLSFLSPGSHISVQGHLSIPKDGASPLFYVDSIRPLP